MAAAATSDRSSSSSSDESDSFGGLHMNCQLYSFEPNVRQRCEVTEYVISDETLGDETNTADSPEKGGTPPRKRIFHTPPNQLPWFVL